MGPHFMLHQPLYVLYANVSYIIISCTISCGNKIVSNLYNCNAFHIALVRRNTLDLSAVFLRRVSVRGGTLAISVV